MPTATWRAPARASRGETAVTREPVSGSIRAVAIDESSDQPTLALRILCKHCGQPARREQRGAHAFVVCGNPECGAVHKLSDDAARRAPEPSVER